MEVSALPDSVIELILEKHASIKDSTLEAADLQKLSRCDLTATDGTLTELCRLFAYNAGEYERQAEPRRLSRLLSKLRASADSRLLDIGCGGGQTALLIHEAAGCECFGVDVDSRAVRFGKRIAGFKGLRAVGLSVAKGESLPFERNSFSHVVCRVAINYMHQRLAIREMLRVLNPGGVLYLQVENAGMDLRLIRSGKTLRSSFAASIEFGFGLLHAAVGYQFDMRSFPGCPGRLFVMNARLTADLRNQGCDILSVEALSHIWGIRCASVLVARKR